VRVCPRGDTVHTHTAVRLSRIAVEPLVGDVILPLVAAISGKPNVDALVLTVNGAEIRRGFS
jgi:hypothetical protein